MILGGGCNAKLKMKNRIGMKKDRQKICVATGTRAEYGLLRWLMEDIQKEKSFDLQVLVTGMHLSHEFGLTYQEIDQDGFVIKEKVEMLVSSDSGVGMAKSMGLGMIGFADALERLKPDLLIILGDRFEMLALASTAMCLKIPIAHLHGGEVTEGAIDEAIRHAITKMAHLHFVATEEYRRRVIQLGEDSKKVFCVGGLGVDAIGRIQLIKRRELENSLGIRFDKKNLLVTFHPPTIEEMAAEKQMGELLRALGNLSDTKIIFTMPNADSGGRVIKKMIQDFLESNSYACAFTSLGQRRYISCLQQVDGVVGNSSSGLLEMPSFKKGTINIGDRQKGRLQAKSVINCRPIQKEIEGAISQLYSASFQKRLKNTKNPYGEPGATKRIIDVLRRTNLKNIFKKCFFDFEF